jgi:hypothetical protein
MSRHRHLLGAFLLALAACDGSISSSDRDGAALVPDGAGPTTDGPRDAAVADGASPGVDGATPVPDAAGPGTTTAAEVAARLGRSHFLIGMGNDLSNNHDQDGAYTLGTTLDLHYAYLVGLMGQGGWPDWNSGGTFVNLLTDSAQAHGVVPMFTLYSMAAWGESNLAVLVDDGYMQPYWGGAHLLFERLAVFDQPAVVHLEPDFWGFAQHQGAPDSIPVHVRAHVSECSDLPDDLTGLGRCLVRLSRTLAPKVVIGFHASAWAGAAEPTATFLRAIGGAEADFVATDVLDRDAGCFEAHVDPNCQRNDGPWYWDETNATSPNFHEHLTWIGAIGQSLALPILWWQVPFGVPSDAPGGTAGHYRDNRVHYIFNHVDEFVAAGGLGVAFGVGAANQTYIDTDGDQFKNAVEGYFASPTPLP